MSELDDYSSRAWILRQNGLPQIAEFVEMLSWMMMTRERDQRSGGG